jgi:hypothetical protein
VEINRLKTVNADHAHIHQYKNLRRKLHSCSSDMLNVVLAESGVILIRFLFVGLEEERNLQKKGGYRN